MGEDTVNRSKGFAPGSEGRPGRRSRPCWLREIQSQRSRADRHAETFPAGRSSAGKAIFAEDSGGLPEIMHASRNLDLSQLLSSGSVPMFNVAASSEGTSQLR